MSYSRIPTEAEEAQARAEEEEYRPSIFKRLRKYARKHPIKFGLITAAIVIGVAAAIVGTVVTFGVGLAPIAAGTVGLGAALGVSLTPTGMVALGAAVSGVAVASTGAVFANREARAVQVRSAEKGVTGLMGRLTKSLAEAGYGYKLAGEKFKSFSVGVTDIRKRFSSGQVVSPANWENAKKEWVRLSKELAKFKELRLDKKIVAVGIIDAKTAAKDRAYYKEKLRELERDLSIIKDHLRSTMPKNANAIQMERAPDARAPSNANPKKSRDEAIAMAKNYFDSLEDSDSWEIKYLLQEKGINKNTFEGKLPSAITAILEEFAQKNPRLLDRICNVKVGSISPCSFGDILVVFRYNFPHQEWKPGVKFSPQQPMQSPAPSTASTGVSAAAQLQGRTTNYNNGLTLFEHDQQPKPAAAVDMMQRYLNAISHTQYWTLKTVLVVDAGINVANEQWKEKFVDFKNKNQDMMNIYGNIKVGDYTLNDIVNAVEHEVELSKKPVYR